MRIMGRKFAITGAGRGLGAALAIVMADAGVDLVLLARSKEALDRTAQTIRTRTGQEVATIVCDLADAASSTAAGEKLAQDHPDLNGLIHNGAMWLPGSFDEITDADIHACIASAAIGSLILTRHLLPVLKRQAEADIHTVVSTSGLANTPLDGTSVAFRAAKAAQDGLVQGLADELKDTTVRVTAVHPNNFEDVSPLDADWDAPRPANHPLTNREVVDAILFTLNLPPSVEVKTLTLQQRDGNS